MPAEARKQMMDSVASSNKDTSINHCIKKDDLSAERIMKGIDDDEDCKYTVTKKTKTEFTGTLTCASGNKGATLFKTQGQEKYSFEFNGTFNGRSDTKFLSEGKFISTNCPKETINN